MITANLPVPPSANELFANKGAHGRRKTDKYLAWIDAAGWELNIQRARPLGGSVAVEIECPENGQRDLDNHAKPVLDLLVHMHLIDGDRNKWVRRIVLSWHSRDDRLHLTVSPA